VPGVSGYYDDKLAAERLRRVYELVPYDNVRLVQADAARLGCRDNVFNVVVVSMEINKGRVSMDPQPSP